MTTISGRSPIPGVGAKPTALQQIAAETPAVYDRQAAAFDRQRLRSLSERIWLERFTDWLPQGARILDLGCGAAEPIATWLIGRGFRVTGLDLSQAMLAIARSRFPDGDWRHGDMRTLDLSERFDGIVGWHSFFHLTREEQRRTLPRLAAHLHTGGVLLLTVGPEDGETVGQVGGEPVYHASLAPQVYATLLGDLGLDVIAFVAEDPECDRNSVLLAVARERALSSPD